EDVDVRANQVVAEEADRGRAGEGLSGRTPGAVEFERIESEREDHPPPLEMFDRPEADHLPYRVQHSRVENEAGVAIASQVAVEGQNAETSGRPCLSGLRDRGDTSP